ncbi:MAG: HPF/RaiA family ribosome-associated protein [Kiritimatiellia bacterium]|jgi:ribosomal subunit interface protein|nr:HPF/RaiA family ribosome-associated protein [Kiritimatiellia bacterium]
MAIEVTVRHQQAAPDVKTYAEMRAGKLIETFPRVESVHVIIDVQRHLYEAEFVVQQKGLTAVGAKEHAPSVRAVIDVAAARAEKQLRKTLSKRVTAHVRKAAKA